MPVIIGHTVAPYAGAWIETVAGAVKAAEQAIVAPYAGAWIETRHTENNPCILLLSLPTRERGLKLGGTLPAIRLSGRSLRGSVD